MNRTGFIDEIFAFFKCKDEDLKRAYDLAFTVKEPIDWGKLYKIVLDNAESRYLPAPKWFKDFFPRCIIRENTAYAIEDGIKIRVNLKDGYNYEFETYQTNYTLPEIKANFMKKFKESFKNIQVFDEDLLEWEMI